MGAKRPKSLVNIKIGDTNSCVNARKQNEKSAKVENDLKCPTFIATVKSLKYLHERGHEAP